MNPPGPLFVSTRADGLCQRLNTLLDVMVLARGFDGRFGFFWDLTPTPAVDQQTHEAPERVFTREFLDRHRLEDAAPDPEAPDLSTRAPTPEELTQLLGRAREGGALYMHHPRDLPSFLSFLGDRFRPDDYVEAFAAIDFADDVRRAIDLARRWPLAPGSVAIHLRGGDILHGTHAHMATYLFKAPTVPEVEAVLATLRAEGRPVWLVGQEPDVQACLSRLHPGLHVIGVTEPAPVLDEFARVIFDVVLMSRMSHLYGGRSGVTRLSQRLRPGLPFTDLDRSRPGPGPETLLVDPLADPRYAGVSAASKAHAYVKPVAALGPSAWTPCERDLIGLARRYRPDSKFLALVEAAVLARLGQAEAAEFCCRTLLSTPLAPELEPELAYAFLLGADHYFPVRVTAPLTTSGTPCCALFGRLNETVRQPDEARRAAARQALREAQAALAPGGIDPVFRQMIERCIVGN